MSRGTIKVMVGRNGVPRIQEDLGDTVKVYTNEEWQKELKKRGEKAKTLGSVGPTPRTPRQPAAKKAATPKTKAVKPAPAAPQLPDPSQPQ